MLEMPLEELAATKQPGITAVPVTSSAAATAAGQSKSGTGSFLLGTAGHLTDYFQQRSVEQESSNALGLHAMAASPLDKLIKRFQFPSSSGYSSTSLRDPPTAAPSATVKTPPAMSSHSANQTNPTPFDPFGAQFGAHSLLDPSSLMFSSYSAASAAQLAPMAAAAAAWTSSPWPWTAAANETTAALLNGCGTGSTSPGGGNPWGTGNYFGGAFGGLVPNQLLPPPQPFPSPNALNPSEPSVQPVQPTSGRSAKNGTGQQKQSQRQPSAVAANNMLNVLMSAGQSAAAVVESKAQRLRGSNGTSTTAARPAGGGKMRANGSAANKSSCECPNCKELQRTGVPLDKKREKHSCHIPGCHKVYSRSSHLKAHLRWHSTDRPATTKKRLFDPPDGPPLIGANKGGGITTVSSARQNR